ncbi:MAG: hypothetical protein ACM4AI_24650 [Acidobacteriota bacterium]
MTHTAHVQRALFLMVGVSRFLPALSMPSNARRGRNPRIGTRRS